MYSITSRADSSSRDPTNAVGADFEWGDADPAQPTVVLAHATGFHARCWDRVIAHLDPSRHVIAIDQRGHGRSAKVPPFNWESFGGDLAGFVDAFWVGTVGALVQPEPGQCWPSIVDGLPKPT